MTFDQDFEDIQKCIDDVDIFRRYCDYFEEKTSFLSSRLLEYFFKVYGPQAVASKTASKATITVLNQYEAIVNSLQMKNFQFFSRGTKKVFKSKVDPQWSTKTTIGHMNFKLWCVKIGIKNILYEIKDDLETDRKFSKKKSNVKKKKGSKKTNKSKRKSFDLLDLSFHCEKTLNSSSNTSVKRLKPKNGSKTFSKKMGIIY